MLLFSDKTLLKNIKRKGERKREKVKTKQGISSTAASNHPEILQRSWLQASNPEGSDPEEETSKTPKTEKVEKTTESPSYSVRLTVETEQAPNQVLLSGSGSQVKSHPREPRRCGNTGGGESGVTQGRGVGVAED